MVDPGAPDPSVTTGPDRRRRGMANEFDVIVIGGGLAGLAAGATAAAQGATAVVLEAHRPGGRARTTERQGFVFNHGGHALYAGGPGMAVLQSLGVRPTGAKPPLHRYQLLLDGRLELAPTGPGSVLRTRAVGSRSKGQLACLLGLLPRLAPDRLSMTSVVDWLADRELRADAEAVVRALIRLGDLRSDLDELGADSAVAQLQIAAKTGVLYLDGGWAQLMTGLSRSVEVRLPTQVRVIDDAGAAGFVVDTDLGRLRAGSVVVATGTPDAVHALLPGAPSWAGLGRPVTAACIDAGVRRIPAPGYVLGVDEPLYATTQSLPARNTFTEPVCMTRMSSRRAFWPACW
jgi:phytoene dehydrogenase-like protein